VFAPITEKRTRPVSMTPYARVAFALRVCAKVVRNGETNLVRKILTVTVDDARAKIRMV
jgi:hypothetical protein